ncbi:MAG: AmmeMemoRadiSam system radical SAM enzyme [Nanoarchaeota archaeon]|nr:AmmeMemoRadiSam system radical SAM enzyme [Nanoarchaeota archaeon]MBU1028104.1 AmmeMemoRadiSam system radical SAM enzyme [Nanoarchaeota archaeon]
MEIQEKEVKLYKKEGKDLRCLACAHKCLISEGKTGICGVRQNIKNKLYLLVYGRIAARHIDPIEKKPLHHFLQNTSTFSIGTVGCNFKCNFCQNHDISQFQEFYGDKILGERLSPSQIVRQAVRSSCKSISYTYNEPTILIEFVKDTSRLARRKKLKNIMVTNGYLSLESFNFIKNYIDAMNIDLKSFTEEFYRERCKASLKPVLETIKRVYKKGIHLEITTLIIPGENDGIEELKNIAKFIASIDKNIPWHISRFFPHHKLMYRPMTSINILQKTQEIGKKYLNNVYIGNI